jgi:hypothetical protein
MVSTSSHDETKKQLEEATAFMRAVTSPEAFTDKYWDRPPSRDKGDSDSDPIHWATGYALSQWENMEEGLGYMFGIITETSPSESVARAYGSIESNSGRRKALLAAAEAYLGDAWNKKTVRKKFTDVINAVEWASKRRDDIAHGIVRGYVVGTKDFGFFLTPPNYNTGRTTKRPSVDNFGFFSTAKYRYTRDDIKSLADKFLGLHFLVTDLANRLRKEAGVIPLVRDDVPEDKKSR